MEGPALSHAQRQWVLTAVGTLGLAGSLVVAQVIVAHRGWRIDLTPEQRYVLSPHARQILEQLDSDVQVTALLRAEDPRNREIEDLLWRVNAVAPQVTYRLVDANRNPGVAREYGVRSYGSLVVEADGRRQVFTDPDEASLVAAIVQVTRPSRRRVYFLTGHGERAIWDTDRRTGYSGARSALIQELCEVEELAVLGERPVPDDASAVIIAGPRSDFLASELLSLDAYLRRGGALLVLLDPGAAPGLAAFLRRYGVIVGDEVVLDAQNRLFAGDFLTMVVRQPSRSHPVTARLQAEPLMSQIRPVSAGSGENVLASGEVLRTAAASWRTPDASVLRTGAGEFVRGRDTRGPVPVGASAVLSAAGRRTSRILVYGDSDFASNFFLDYLGNRDLLLNSVNWLTGERRLIASRRPVKAPGINQFFLSARQGAIAFWLGTVVQPGLMLALGIAVYAYRRRTG
jgi:ABC-type uncharacterized transport system involved in gliding motility auxiliary subunit